MVSTDGEKERGYVEGSCVLYGINVVSAEMLEVSLLVEGTVLRLGRDALSTIK